MKRYRGINSHRPTHPKIWVISHTQRAEIEYFQGFKNFLATPLLVPKKIVCIRPQQLVKLALDWKNAENISEADGDQVWCIFDVDNFYKDDPEGLSKAIKLAHENNIKIAYTNECFELWVLLHFEKPTSSIPRGDYIEKRIIKAFKKNKLGSYEKNQNCFIQLLPFQDNAIKNANELMAQKYEDIQWGQVLESSGNPSTNLHLLILEIKKLMVS